MYLALQFLIIHPNHSVEKGLEIDNLDVIIVAVDTSSRPEAMPGHL